MTPPRSPVSAAELEVLRALWARGPARVRDLLPALPQAWAYTTVQTLLHRLQRKGCVLRQPGDGAAVYRASVTRDELLQRQLGELSAMLGDGSVTAMLHGVVAGRQLTKAEIDELRALLDRLEQEAPRSPAKKARQRKR